MRFRLKSGINQLSSGHTARIGGKRIKVVPGQVIECDKGELGNFLYLYDQLDPDPPDPIPEFRLRPISRSDGKGFDVISDAIGDRINDVLLTEEQALSITENQEGLDDMPRNNLWTVPRIWDKAECFILGGGPSLRNVDVNALNGRHVIAVNNAFELGDWIDVCYFGDLSWFRRNKPKIKLFPGLKVTRKLECCNQPDIKVVKHILRPYGISKNPSVIYWNKSSGASAINLAVLLGATRIILFGFDMRLYNSGEVRSLPKDFPAQPTRNNWHNLHPVSRNSKRSKYMNFLEPFTMIAKDLDDMNIECLNATPGSALDKFPIVDPNKIINGEVERLDNHSVSIAVPREIPKNDDPVSISRYLTHEYLRKCKDLWGVKKPIPTRLRRRHIFVPIPTIWDDATCFILGGGPSLAGFDVSRLEGSHVLAVNNAYKIAPWADVLFWGNCYWYQDHAQRLKNFRGLQITSCQRSLHVPNKVKFIRCNFDRFGISSSKRYLIWNLNAGACAVNLAIWLGARRIILLGYDMKQGERGNNWHNDHITSDKPEHNPYPFYLKAWPRIAQDARRLGIEILNATPGSTLQEFPLIDLKERKIA